MTYRPKAPPILPREPFSISILERLFGLAAIVGWREMTGKAWRKATVTEIDPSTGHETLYSLLKRRQDELRVRPRGG